MSKRIKDGYEILQASMENLQKINQELSLESAENKARLRSLERENARLTERCAILEQSIEELKQDFADIPAASPTTTVAETPSFTVQTEIENAGHSADMIIRRAEAERERILSSARLEGKRIVTEAKAEVRRLYDSMATAEDDIAEVLKRLGRLQKGISDKN